MPTPAVGGTVSTPASSLPGLQEIASHQHILPYSRFFSLVKYIVSQILVGSNFRHRASVRKLNSDKNLILSKIIFGLNT